MTHFGYAYSKALVKIRHVPSTQEFLSCGLHCQVFVLKVPKINTSQMNLIQIFDQMELGRHFKSALAAVQHVISLSPWFSETCELP